MNQAPRLLQLLADPRIGALFLTAKPALVLDAEGRLLLANGASIALLRGRSRRDVAEAIAAERGPLASILRQLRETDAPQTHALPIRVGGTRRPVQFSASRFALPDGEVFFFAGIEPANGKPDTSAAAAALFGDEADAIALFDINGLRLYANAAAGSLIGSAAALTEIIPGAHGALAKARSGGDAELPFGVLRILLQRIGTEEQPFIAAAFAAPARPAAESAPVAKPVKEPAKPAVKPEQPSTPPAEIVSAKNPDDERPSIEAAAPATEEIPAAKETAAQERKPAETKKEPSKPPSRFVWQTDAEGRFTSVSPELAAVVGAEPAALSGLDWLEAGDMIGIEGTEAVSAAVARRDTWSSVSVIWPVEGGELVRPVELAALPVFDRERQFLGYRGFGVFRDPIKRTPAARKSARKEEPAAPIAKSPEAPKRSSIVDDELPDVVPVFGKRTENVVSLHKSASHTERPTLTPIERNAFREIAKAIGSRMDRVGASARGRASDTPPPAAPKPEPAPPVRIMSGGERAVLDRLPLGVIVHRGDVVLYANRTVLDWTGYMSTEELALAGGLDRIFSAGHAFGPDDADEHPRPIAIRGRGGEPIPVEARLVSTPWDGDTALVYMLRRAGAGLDERMEAGELALRDAEATAREMRAILDTATDGVALLDRAGNVLGVNRSAEALFGFDSAELEGRNFTLLFAPESHRAAADYLDGLATNGVASVLNDGREVIGRVREGGLIPLFMTLGRIDDTGQKFCAVFRDITQWKRAEEELVHARRQAERANSAKSDFLAKISHELRTPLSSIIGFAEVMIEERLGTIGNERYKEYLRDIHTSGEHLVSLINDLLDLSKIEAGKLDLSFASVDLNEIASQSMALMQPQANRERIIIRTALSTSLPPVVADARSIRQIVLNLLSNSIRFTQPGGQVIVSTTLTDDGEVHLRVRDTGIGMTETEIKTALEPFRQVTTSGRGKEGGTGLGLPLTKALVEANRASFSIKSTVNAGTLVEIAFPSTRVLAE